MKIVQAACVISLALLTSAVQSEELSISDLPPTRTFDSTPKLAFGQVIRYGNKTVFSPCRDPSFTNFEDASSDGRIGKALDKLGLSAGKKLYVEVLGIREGDALRATDMNFAQTDGRCQMPGGKTEIWRASGNEPAWMLAFGAEFVQVKRVGKPEVMVPAAPLTLEPGLATFSASKDNQSVSLRFERQLCYDTMADAVFGWTASVTANGETLKGCAWQR
jgi:putative lipoprotein